MTDLPKSQLFECTKCHKHKTRILVSKIKVTPTYNRYHYVDEHGKRWNSSYCPPCHHKDLARRAKVRRAKTKGLL